MRPCIGGAFGSQLKRSPATCGKRPAPSSTWLTPFSSAATMPAPVMLKVESVFWNGSTASTSPMVTVPPPIEARRPPPFCSAIVTPWSLTRSSIASATRLPIAHSCARQVSRLPSMSAATSATTRDFSSSIGPASSSIRARMSGSGVTLASSSMVSPLGRGHLAGVVEGEAEVAEVLRVGPGLHDRHLRPVGRRRPSAGT